MKKLTLNQAWTLCLRQWRWIAEQVKKGASAGKDIGDLKNEWIRKNGYPEDSNCFFCLWAEQQLPTLDTVCPNCPAKKIDKKFHCCEAIYDYWDKPLAFYTKLLKLNKIRTSKRGHRKGTNREKAKN